MEELWAQRWKALWFAGIYMIPETKPVDQPD